MQDYLQGKTQIVDFVRPCAQQAGGACPSIPLDYWLGKTVQHTLTVRFGINGQLNYAASNVANGATLLTYAATGDLGSSSSLKFGNYRNHFDGMAFTEAFVGDYSAVKH